MATDDEKLQMALAVFKHLSPSPGQVLSPYDFLAVAAANSWRNLDVLDGVKAGYTKGFFDDGPNYGVQLTPNGLAAISPLTDSSRAETAAFTKSIEISQTETSTNLAENEMSPAGSLPSSGEGSTHDKPFPIFEVEEDTTA
jgi:hypothetical protein